ncbi:MAG: hypothetical protein VZR95_06390 [Alphaproteobacteria bacterium]
MEELLSFLPASQTMVIALLMSAWVGISLVLFEKPDDYRPRNVWVRRVERIFTIATFVILFFVPRIQDPIVEYVPALSYPICVMVCFLTGLACAIATALIKWMLCLKG